MIRIPRVACCIGLTLLVVACGSDSNSSATTVSGTPPIAPTSTPASTPATNPPATQPQVTSPSKDPHVNTHDPTAPDEVLLVGESFADKARVDMTSKDVFKTVGENETVTVRADVLDVDGALAVFVLQSPYVRCANKVTLIAQSVVLASDAEPQPFGATAPRNRSVRTTVANTGSPLGGCRYGVALCASGENFNGDSTDSHTIFVQFGSGPANAPLPTEVTC